MEFALGSSSLQLLDSDLNLASCVNSPWPSFSCVWSQGDCLLHASFKPIDPDVNRKK